MEYGGAGLAGSPTCRRHCLCVGQQGGQGIAPGRGDRRAAQIPDQPDGERAGAGLVSRDGDPGQFVDGDSDGAGAAMPGNGGGAAVRAVPGAATRSCLRQTCDADSRSGPDDALSNRLAFAQTFAEMVAPQLQEALNQGMEQGGTSRRPRDACGISSLRSRNPNCRISRWPNWPNNCTAANGTPAGCFERSGEPASRLMCRIFGLKKACHLLLHGNLKIIDVALESGHGS